jgi:peptidoglycan hydrolase-like protein with peptidoglycan-binding domain
MAERPKRQSAIVDLPVRGDIMRSLLLTSALAIGLTAAPLLMAQSAGTIRSVQQALNDKGFDPGPIDGIMGPRTRSAIRSYEKQQNMPANGALTAKVLDGLGVQAADEPHHFDNAGRAVKGSYSQGGKDVGTGSVQAGHELKKGEVTAGAKDFGEGIGEGAKKVGKGTKRAVKSAAKGVKDAFDGDPNNVRDQDKDKKPQ